MCDFHEWLKANDVHNIIEFIDVGKSEDWSSRTDSTGRLNDEKYGVRGIRSKYVANMKAGHSPKIKSKRSPK